MTPAQYGALKTFLLALGGALVYTALGFLSNPANLGGLLNPSITIIVVAVAGAIEEAIKANTGNGLLGSTEIR